MNCSLRLISLFFIFASVAFGQSRSESYQLLLQQVGSFDELNPRHKCGFPVFAALYEASSKTPQLTALFKSAFGRPRLPRSYVTPDNLFRIHYTVTGDSAVNSTSTIVDGVPDYIYEAGVAAQKAHHLLHNVLGFDLPISDGSEGGGPEYDFYVINEQRDYGHTEWNAIDAAGRGPAYSFVDNNYTGYNTTGLAALRVTVAHEYFHGVQLNYRYSTDGRFFLEMSSTWFEDFAYDEVNDYYFYLDDFFNNPNQSLHETSGYEVSHWLHYLTKRLRTTAIVLDLWEAYKIKPPAIEAFKTVLESSPYSMPFTQAFSEFNTWCYFTGPRADSAQYFEEGLNYPQILFIETVRIESDSTINDGLFSVAANFYRAIRDPQKVQVVLQTDEPNRWMVTAISKNNQQYILSSGVGLTPIEVAASSQGDTIVVAVVNTSLPASNGQSIFSDYQLQFNSTGKLEIADMLGKPYPNPFRGAGLLYFPFQLSQRATVEAAILREDGKVMRSFKWGELGAGVYSKEWNGQDDSGNRVASGVYFFQIIAGSFHELTKFVVIN